MKPLIYIFLLIQETRHYFHERFDRKKMTATSSMLVVLEGNSHWNTDSKITVNWDKTTVPPDQISLPTQVDDRVLEIKKEFLAWAYEVSQIQIDGKTVTEHLKIFDGLSFWWMTLMGEKSPYKCPALYSVFKLRALERLYQHNDCRGIIFKGNDSALEQTLSQWCIEMGHPYKYVPSSSKKTFHFSLKHLFLKLPYLLQACVWLIHKAWTRFRLVSSARITPETEMAEVTLVTFFPNIDRKKTEQGQFTSRYWKVCIPCWTIFRLAFVGCGFTSNKTRSISERLCDSAMCATKPDRKNINTICWKSF